MSKKNKVEKTNVMRLLDKEKITYITHEYDPEKAVSAKEVASILSQDVKRVFKTLVTTSKSKEHYVFVIPGEEELDLKKAASAADEKFIEMLPQKELLPLTGYVHGGCSPIGMKKKFVTFLDSSAKNYPTIFISGGKRGVQVEVDPLILSSFIEAQFVDLTGEKQE